MSSATPWFHVRPDKVMPLSSGVVCAVDDDAQYGVKEVGGRRFIDSEAGIRAYLSRRYGVATAK